MFDFGNANDNQRKAIECVDGPLLITAGPGTGKTATLDKRTIYMIQDIVVQAKKDAAKEVAVESHMEYIMYAGKRVMSENILETEEQ